MARFLARYGRSRRIVRALRAWLMRARSLRSTRSERELEAELESHLQLHTEDNLRAGMAPDEARRRALLALEGSTAREEEYRDRRGIPAVEALARDLRHGARTLLKNPGFTLAGIVILGLGIGVNSAIFTVVNAVVLKPLPFDGADRIMRVWHTPPPSSFTSMQISRCRRRTSSIGRRRIRSSIAWPSTRSAGRR